MASLSEGNTAETVADKAMEQYDSEKMMTFYQLVMGGGGYDIHYGIYRDEGWGVQEASRATTDFMLCLMDWMRPLRGDSKVLDIGSGHGGAMHAMVQKYGCHVHGYNLSAEQNRFNMEECKRLGILEKVSTSVGNVNDGLPAEWEGTYDFVHSCEVFCHVADKAHLLKEIYRVLKPGGILVFSDIMGADDASEELLKPFTDHNATLKMGRPKEYIEHLKESGLVYVAWVDMSNHLKKFFLQMVEQIDKHMDILMSKGSTLEYLNNWKSGLTNRADSHATFAWGFFCARKP